MIGRSNSDISSGGLERRQQFLQPFRRISAIGINGADQLSTTYLKPAAECRTHAFVPAMLNDLKWHLSSGKLLLEPLHRGITASVVYKNEFQAIRAFQQSFQLEKLLVKQPDSIFFIEDGNHHGNELLCGRHISQVLRS